MAIFSVLLASLFISAKNLFMRRSLDKGGTTKTYLAIQMGMAFLVAVLLGPVKTGEYALNIPLVIFGLCAGVILSLMLCFLGKSLACGPPGLTFSILSSAAVVPAILMAMLFGAALGFSYTAWHGIGSALVLAGLFWAGKGFDGMKDKRTWILFSSAMFAMHVFILAIYQWRAIVLGAPDPEELTSFLTREQIRSQWFMPMIYFSATLIQLAIFLKTHRRKPNPKEWIYGCAGGICNGLCTFFLIKGTEIASGLECLVIFPCFSIGIIFFSNLWGQHLYRERVNWRACQICALGVFIGTVDWKVVNAAIGF